MTGKQPDSVRPAWAGFPIHPVLIPAFPILFLLARNLGEVDPAEAVGPLVVAVGLTVVLAIWLRVIGIALPKAAFIASIGAIVVLYFGNFVSAMDRFRINETRLLIAWLATAAVLVLVVLRVRRDLSAATALVNLIAGVLVAFQLATIGPALLAAFRPPEPPPTPSITPGSPLPTSSATVGNVKRDIYYLVVEDYGSRRTLEQYLRIDDDGIFDWLSSKGFTVLPETRSNYGRTPLSMASSLNMTYLDDVARAMGPDSDSYAPINRMVANSAVATFLKDRGYTIAQLGSQYYLTTASPIADVNPRFPQTSDFLGVLYDTTILPPIATRLGYTDAFSDRRRNYDAAMWGLSELPKLRDVPGPKFVFFHLFLPHPPYVVDRDGTYVTARADGRRTREQRLGEQWSFVHAQLRAMIEPLLAGPEETRPIIILTTDEGPNPPRMPIIEGDIDWSQATDAQLDQKFGIFAAYYLPGVTDTRLYPTMSSVNSFRLVFDLYFGADLPLLPDRNYIHRDKHHPYLLTHVTARLPLPAR